MSLKYTGDYYKNPDICIDQYLEEQKEVIFKKINEHDRLLLVAPTGSGKTSLFRKNTKELLKKFERIIFVFPLLSIQKQLDDEWNTDLSLNFGIKKQEATEKFTKAKRISSTYRSLYKISHLINENDLIVLDEIHTLFNDNLPSLNEDNRDRIISAIEDVFICNANVVAMSATPQPFISKALGFNPFVITYSNEISFRKINIVYVPFYQSYLLLQINNALGELAEGEKLVIYYKNKDRLSFYYNYFNDSSESENSIITGDILRSNEIEIDTYLDKVFHDNRIIYTTNAIATGVSIYNKNVKKIIIFDVYESDEIVQVASRFRNVFDIEINVLIDDSSRENSRYSFNKVEISQINYYSKYLRNKDKSFFNHGVLESLKTAQLKLSKDRYKGVSSKNLGSELEKFPNFSVRINRDRQSNIDINFKEVRNKFFTFSDDISKLRYRVVIDLELTNFDEIMSDLLKTIITGNEYENYNVVLTAFAEPEFKSASKRYFALNEIIETKTLLNYWNYLNSSNVRNIEVGVIANDIFKLIKSDTSYSVSSAEWLKHNYSIIEKVFNQAIKLSRFKQESLQDDFFNNKHLLYFDNKLKLSLIQKDIVSIVRSMFKLSTKGKGKKVNKEYFHYFKQPTFENAKFISDDKLVYAKEGEDDVIYIYDWDKTNDNLVIQKELSKVLVSDEELIRNILNK